VATECEEGPGRTVRQLPDVVVPEVRVEEVTTDATEVEGADVPGTVVEGFLVAAVLVDAGCVIEYEAPGGCLGAVEITAATIPASTIPEVVLPGGETTGKRVLDAVTAPAVTAPAVRTEQVCQIEVDGELPTVSRAGVVRPAVSRSGVARPGTTRPERCGEDGCVPQVRVDAVRMEPAQLADVDVDPGRLSSQDLTADVDVISAEGGAERAFVAPADLLFATGEFTLQPGAITALEAIQAEVSAARSSATMRVEGHTDDVGDDASNVELSRRRAQEVAAWLLSNTRQDPEALTVTGLGEVAPAFPNDTDAGRQGNRRVVVTVG